MSSTVKYNKLLAKKDEFEKFQKSSKKTKV